MNWFFHVYDIDGFNCSLYVLFDKLSIDRLTLDFILSRFDCYYLWFFFYCFWSLFYISFIYSCNLFLRSYIYSIFGLEGSIIFYQKEFNYLEVVMQLIVFEYKINLWEIGSIWVISQLICYLYYLRPCYLLSQYWKEIFFIYVAITERYLEYFWCNTS